MPYFYRWVPEPTRYRSVWAQIKELPDKVFTKRELQEELNMKELSPYLKYFVDKGYLDRVGKGKYAKTPRGI